MYLRSQIDAPRAETAGLSDGISPPHTPPEEAVSFDWAALVQSLGDDEILAAEIVTLYIAEAPVMMERVRAAVRSESAEEIRQAAHAFKGAVGNLSRIGPMQTAGQLEEAARNGSMAGLPALLDVLERQVDSLQAELRSLNLGKDTCAS
jgi:HPt (histidine-containing phosphotransfer) domain-containing protein